MIKIIYNGSDPFDPYPVPLVALDNEGIYYGEKWAQKDTLTLNGQITGCSFDKILSGYSQLKERFSKSYQPFTIWQITGGGSGVIYQADVAQLLNFNISPQRWLGILDYSIDLECYPSGSFSGVYGVLEPSDEWNLEEGADYRGNITHTISCLGLNTSNDANNALDNAKNWAAGRRGLNSFVAPAFIENINTGQLCLIQSSEIIDRFNGTYSLTDTYTTDLTRMGYGILRYSTTIESGNSLISVSLNGSVEGCGQNLMGARETFNSLDKYGAALLNYQRSFNRNDLNPTPLSYEVNEDPFESVIDFAYQFNNDNSPETYFDYTVTVNSGDSITASIQGNVISRGGDSKTKLNKSLAFSSGVDLYSLTRDFYNEFYPNYSVSPLNPNPLSSGLSKDEVNGVVGLSAEFGNAVVISGLQSITYTLSFSPQLRKFDSQPRINGQGLYSVVDLGYTNRASLSIVGDATISDGVNDVSGLAIVKNKLNSLFSQYGKYNNAVLSQNQINYSRFDKKVVNFSVVWSFDSENNVISGENYSQVNTLIV